MAISRRSLLAMGLGLTATGFVRRSHARPAPERAVLTIRRAVERGHANHGWLDSHHSFSFADYYDPNNMGFRALRVINEDRIKADSGFPMHPHRDMEIVTYVMEGGLTHKDSLGNGGIIVPGEVQRMSAGTGIRHSEFNASHSESVHLLQIWLMPERTGYAPSYEQRPLTARGNQLRLIASPDGAEKSVTIGQNCRLHAATLGKGDGVRFVLQPRRHVWLQVARGLVTVNGETLEGGDAAYGGVPGTIELTGDDISEVLLFDLA
ncbi:MAG: pirin family protein [Myxococcota bacterium]|nr:pirin family protein [Myxococcota bacterium]